MGGSNTKDYDPSGAARDPGDSRSYSEDSRDDLREHRRGTSIALAVFALVAFLILAVSLGLVAQSYLWIRDAKEDLGVLEDSLNDTCANVTDYFAVGVQAPLAAVIDTNTSSIIEIPSYLGTSPAIPVCVQDYGQVWFVSNETSEILVMDILTKAYIDRIDVFRFGCDTPMSIAYNANAGGEGEGQVWVSCSASDNVLVFNPQYRNVISVITIPLPLSNDAGVVAVGPGFAVVVLFPGSYMVYDTETFVGVQGSISGGATDYMAIHYGADGHVYIYAAIPSRIYQMTPDAVAHTLTQKAMSAVTPTDVTDIKVTFDGETLYAALGTSGVAVYATSDISLPKSGSPTGTVIGPARFIAVSKDATLLAVSTGSGGNHVAQLPIASSTGVPTSVGAKIYSLVETGATYGVVECEMTCPCDLCHGQDLTLPYAN